MIVIDANVALHLAGGDLFSRVRQDLVAPALLWSEVAAAVRRGVSTGRVGEDLATRTLERVLVSGIRRRTADELYRRAFAIAAQLGWSKSYDAEYVALAQLEGVPLVTLGARVRQRAAALVETVDVAAILA